MSPPYPASHDDVICFITKLYNDGCSPSTITTKMSAISYAHKMRNLPDPTSHFMVSKVLTGMRKTAPSADTRVPLTFTMLTNIISAIPSVGWSHFWATTYQAMLSLSFHAFLRPGEITDSPNNLQFQDITIHPNQKITITFHRFKHHVGEPYLIDILPGQLPSCPLLLLTKFLNIRGSLPGSLFCDASLKPISYSQYNNAFSAVKTLLQLPPALSPHSARIGAATHAASIGIPELIIQKMGRWSSDAYTKYIRVTSFSTQSVGYDRSK